MEASSLTIGEYYLISLGRRLLAGTVYALLCTMLSVFLYNYVFLFVSGLGILGLNFVLYSMRVYTPDSLLKHMNLLTVSVCDPLYTRYRTVNLFGQVTGFIPLLMILYGILLLTAVVTT